MEGIGGYILFTVGIWLLKKFTDWLVKRSKKTEKNKVDDFFAEMLQEIVGKLPKKPKK